MAKAPLKTPLKPRAFRLDDPDVVMAGEDGPRARGAVVVTPEADALLEEAEVVAVEPVRRSRWGTLLWSALGGLLSLAIGLWVTRLVDELFSYSDWLGWLGAALAALAALAFLAILIRETDALLRLQTIEALHDRVGTIVA